MASQLLDGCTPIMDYEDATFTATGSAAGEAVLVTFDNAADPASVDASIARAIALIVQYYQNLV